jgi:hypothetical protein
MPANARNFLKKTSKFVLFLFVMIGNQGGTLADTHYYGHEHEASAKRVALEYSVASYHDHYRYHPEWQYGQNHAGTAYYHADEYGQYYETHYATGYHSTQHEYLSVDHGYSHPTYGMYGGHGKYAIHHERYHA